MPLCRHPHIRSKENRKCRVLACATVYQPKKSFTPAKNRLMFLLRLLNYVFGWRIEKKDLYKGDRSHWGSSVRNGSAVFWASRPECKISPCTGWIACRFGGATNPIATVTHPRRRATLVKKYPLGRPDCEKKTLGKLVFSVSLVSPQNRDYQLPRVVTILQRGYTCETCLEENYL